MRREIFPAPDTSGFEQASTIAEINAMCDAAYTVIATEYYAGEREMPRLIAATHAREDVDRAADKARDRIVYGVLSSLGRKAA